MQFGEIWSPQSLLSGNRNYIRKQNRILKTIFLALMTKGIHGAVNISTHFLLRKIIQGLYSTWFSTRISSWCGWSPFRHICNWSFLKTSFSLYFCRLPACCQTCTCLESDLKYFIPSKWIPTYCMLSVPKSSLNLGGQVHLAKET